MDEFKQVKCAWCGELFPMKYWNQLYCGERCRILAKSQRRVDRGGKPIYTLRRHR